MPFTSFPISHHCRFDSQPFHVLLLRRLWLPLPSTARTCLCGLPLDPCGHHRAACSVAGVLGRLVRRTGLSRGRGQMSLNVRVQDMLALPDALDNRCLEIVAWASLVSGSTVGCGHHTSVSPEAWWGSSPAFDDPRRSCFDGRPPSEGAGLPRAHRPEGSHTACWSWPGRWEVGGPRNAVSSSTSWRRPRPDGSPGGTDGRLSWLAARPKPLPFLCKSTGAVWVPMVTLHSPLR